MKKIEKKIMQEKEICKQIGKVKFCSQCGATKEECEEYRRIYIRPYLNDFILSGKNVCQNYYMFRK